MRYCDLFVGTLMIVGAFASQPDVKLAEEQQPLAFDKKVGFELEQRARQAKKNAVSKVEHPDYVPYTGEVKDAVFFEQFNEPEDKIFSKWKTSHAKKAITDEKEEFSYVGEWAIEEATVIPGLLGDKGLVLKTPAAHHAISRRFDTVLDNTGKTLVVQYEVKLQQGLTCGGAYLKLLSDSEDYSTKEFSNDTPYEIMFGPDKCGATDKIHFILRRKNQNTGEVEEKHLVAPPRTFPGTVSTLYTLILRPNQEYEIRVNGDVRKAGFLTDEGTFNPPLNPPKEIEDENETKPEDWDDNPYIPDPEQTVKPDDWDEDAPLRIPDLDAEKPEDWREDLEEYIPDPDAEKPEDWDDEEDGEWAAPLVLNPECEDISGCGPWEPPLVKNPDYRGKWRQPQVENPNYQGEWTPSLIPNPEYYEDSRPSDLEPIAGIGLELWTMQSDILFNNFYIGHSVEEAEVIGNATFLPKLEVERDEYAANAPEPPKGYKESTFWEMLKSDPVNTLIEMYKLFMLEWNADKTNAIKHQPIAAGIILGGFVFSATALFGLLSAIIKLVSKKPAPAAPKEKKSAKKSDEKKTATDGQASGAAKDNAESLRKRN